MNNFHKRKNYIPLLLLIIIEIITMSSASALVHNNKSYGFIYWENGHPTRLGGTRRPQSQANTYARANPNLIVQTGYYSMRLDCDDMNITGFNALNGSNYMSALNEDVTQFSAATLNLFAYKGNVRYQCKSARIQSTSGDYVRLIESGQYLQRFDLVDLVFEDSSGNDIGFSGVLEVTAWPDRLVFNLDFSDTPSVTRTTIQLITPNGTQLIKDTMSGQAFLLTKPQSQSYATPFLPSSWIQSAVNKATNAPLNVEYNEAEAALHIDVPAAAVSYANNTSRVDEYVIELNNPTNSEQNLPLVFEQPIPRAITGTVMTLCHENDGSSIGQAIQISKNWHTANPTMHMGEWLRGSTMVTLAANETKSVRLRVIYGYWGGAATASHSQLSLIGYSGNWKWDESALGSWGESLTYDPTQHSGAAFMADIRPSFTTPNNSATSTHNWTENVGGAEFLVYYDSNNVYRWVKRIKTAYQWTGPNITKIHYSGVTDDDKIRVNYTTSLVRTNDCHRTFLDYSYEFLQNVTSPKRLAFFTLAADYYNTVDFTSYHRGHAGGKAQDYTASPGGNAYKSKFSFRDRWLAIDDHTADENTIRARRGLLGYESTLNGSSFNAYLHTYGRSWGFSKMTFDLSSSSVTRSYSAGDLVTGKLGLILTPNSESVYWGSDNAFKDRLASYNDAWSSVYDEYRYNRNMDVTVNVGTLLNTYPLEIASNSNINSQVLGRVTINAGGIGHIPITLKNVIPEYGVTVQIKNGSSWEWLDADILAHDYYQGVMNKDGKMDYCFNIVRPSSNLTGSFKIRFLKKSAP